jgi:hypothetical protein
MSRGIIRPTTREDAIVRALSMLSFVGRPPGAPPGTIDTPIGYRLDPGHNGGQDPYAPHCAQPSFGDRAWTADCVGLVLWALGIDRKQPGFGGTSGEWLHCPSMIADAHGDRVYFEPVADDVALPGDLLVTIDHVGMLLRRACGDLDALVVDCSPAHGRRSGVGTRVAWSDGAQVIRYLRFAEG